MSARQRNFTMFYVLHSMIRVSGKTTQEARSEPQSYLTFEEEEELTSFLLQAAKIGYPHTRKQIIALVQQIIHNKGITTTITNGWWERFLKRHPHLTLQVAVPLSYARALASDPEVINRYNNFDMLEDCLQSNGLFNKAPCIINCDETGVPLDPVYEGSWNKEPKLSHWWFQITNHCDGLYMCCRISYSNAGKSNHWMDMH